MVGRVGAFLLRNSMEPFLTRKNMPPWGILVRRTIGNPAYKFFKSIREDCNFFIVSVSIVVDS